MLGVARLQLGVYNLSGSDSTGRFNRWLRKIGEEPVIFDSLLTDQSARQLKLALINSGYNDAEVEYEAVSSKDRKIDVTYHLYPGAPHVIESIAYEFDDPSLREIVLADSMSLPVKAGGLLDMKNLDAQRTVVAERMREKGYFAFTKEYVTFIADTVAGSKNVDLTMVLRNPKSTPSETTAPPALPPPAAEQVLAYIANHRQYVYRNVIVVPDFSPGDNTSDLAFANRDTVKCQGLEILYGPDRYLSPGALAEQVFIRPGQLYSTSGIDRTYEALNRLSILRYVNILTRPVGNDGDTELLEAYILLSPTKKMGVTLELEGTNSEGDFGVGGGVTFQHRNLAHGSELLTTKLRGSYESLSGNLDGLINNRYTEFAGEVGITLPRFECPFLSKSFKQRRLASTEFTFSANYQERPEYTRIILGTAWKWKWQQQRADYLRRQTFDLIDINYVRLPRSTINFIDEIAPSNPLLRYSYEDHFIMRMGYTFSRTNRRLPSATVNALSVQPHVTSIRLSAEMAGNLLYGISNMIGQKKSSGVYKIFGIQYAQYVKGEADFTYTRNFNSRNSLAMHCGLGIAYPYGNSSMVPFEKRFYAGGANGVRGWGVRTLGPGSYDAKIRLPTSSINAATYAST